MTLSDKQGFIVETPFYVISNLPDGRFLDLIGRNMVIKTRNGFLGRASPLHSIFGKLY